MQPHDVDPRDRDDEESHSVIGDTYVRERGNRYEYQDPPMSEDPPNRLNHPQ